MEFYANINGIPNTVTYREGDTEGIFLPLLRKLTAVEKEKGRRILVYLAAPPGTGKTTLLALLKKLSEEREDLSPVTTIGIDGFHHYQSFLDTHTTIRDGRKILMAEVKGAPETFDRELLEERIRKVAAGETCSWPDYDRTIGDPREDVFRIDEKSRVVILEGNYLLLDTPGWKNLRSYADFTIRITADEDVLRERLVKRRIMGGKPRGEAEKFVDYSDMANARLVLGHSGDADLVLKSERDGFRVLSRGCGLLQTGAERTFR